jgi:hypothetical protein
MILVMDHSRKQVQTKDNHMIRKVEIERFSFVTSKQFDDVVAAWGFRRSRTLNPG